MGHAVSFCERIRHARASLESAEASFRANHEVRGELDLMLAEAELQNLRKKQPRAVAWSRRTLAFSCVALIFISGFGGWWWASISRAEKQIPGAVQAASGKEVSREQVLEISRQQSSSPVTAMTDRDATVLPPVMGKSEFGPDAGEKFLSEGQNQMEASIEKENAVYEKPVEKQYPQAAAVKYQEPEPAVQLSSAEIHSLVRKGRQELGNSK